MRNGDLSNESLPRIVVVFENAIGYLPDANRARWKLLARRGRWDEVARLFDLDQLVLRRITDLSYRASIHIDVVTYCGPQAFAEALARLFDHENVPVRIVQAETPERMARRTSYEPDIVAIYDGNREHALVYGRKGVILTDYRQLGGS